MATRRELTQLRNQMTGHTFNPSYDPAMFTERPWNSWTFQRTSLSSEGALASEITVGDVIDQIRARCNINPEGAQGVANDISIRISSAAVWCTASGLILPDIEAVFYELDPNAVTASIRRTQRDQGTLNRPARCGYKYPLTDSKAVLSEDSRTTPIATAVAGSAGSDITVRLTCVWKSSA
jgi:hypothetical protein